TVLCNAMYNPRSTFSRRQLAAISVHSKNAMKPIYLMTVVCMVALLTACASSKKIFLPDGSSGFRINCKSAVYSHSPSVARGQCLEQAGKTCGDRGYRTIETGDYYMVIQCNSPAGSANTSATPAFVSLPDDAIAARLLGAWSCNMEIAESHASAQGVSTYSRDGKYTAAGTISFQSDVSGNALGVSTFSDGEWWVENGRLITTARNIRLRALTTESEEIANALRQDALQPGAVEAIRFTALTDDYAVAVSESNNALKQYCRKQPG
ncbi:MAG: hypothetical protein MPK62_10490, partial [Alphaproteobacteria bacterium]|nr:hypothetical protein [Alphaproteobacteria bacterium]